MCASSWLVRALLARPISAGPIRVRWYALDSSCDDRLERDRRGADPQPCLCNPSVISRRGASGRETGQVDRPSMMVCDFVRIGIPGSSHEPTGDSGQAGATWRFGARLRFTEVSNAEGLDLAVLLILGVKIELLDAGQEACSAVSRQVEADELEAAFWRSLNTNHAHNEEGGPDGPPLLLRQPRGLRV